MSYKAEAIGKAVTSLLQTKIAAALTAVAARWTTDAITLGSVSSWEFGHRPTILEKESTYYPAISVMVGDSEPVVNADQWMLSKDRYPVLVDVFVTEETEEKVAKKLLRYVEAMLDVFEANQQITSALALNGPPSVQFSEVGRQYGRDLTTVAYFVEYARVSLVVEA